MSKIALVLGFGGKSGVAAVNFLLKKGYMVKANDIKEKKDLIECMEKISDKKKVQFICGSHNTEILNNVDIVVISPGVPSDIAILKKAKELKLTVLSEVELAWQHFPLNWICITGTDGKSTTTSLIGQILTLKYPDTIIGGNLGVPLTEMILDAKESSYIVAELSSFQLENIIHLKPKIGVLINIAPDHLNRYHDFNEYVEAKFNLFKNQTEEDFSVFNKDNKITMKWLQNKDIKSHKFYFSFSGSVEAGAFYENKNFNWKYNMYKETIFQDGLQEIKGEHNKENILAAITVAKLLKIENEYIIEGIKSFKGLPHRMELVRKWQERSFFNDSKATTTSAVSKSIIGFDNIILIMGGRDKGMDYSELNEILNKKVKKLILTGELKEKIKNSVDYPENNVVIIDDFKEAIEKAYKVSSPGDNIILAPGGTSYDRFKNFKERGETFKKIVNQLT